MYDLVIKNRKIYDGDSGEVAVVDGACTGVKNGRILRAKHGG